MHEGLTVDPRTGWDQGPPVGRLSRVLRRLVDVSVYPLILAAFAPFPLQAALWIAFLLCVGAHVLVLGQEARALSRCEGADTSASRQLRWERALLESIAVFFFGGSLVVLGVHVLRGRFSLPTWSAVAFLPVAAAAIGMAVPGLRLAFRHRPPAIGRGSRPSPAD